MAPVAGRGRQQRGRWHAQLLYLCSSPANCGPSALRSIAEFIGACRPTAAAMGERGHTCARNRPHTGQTTAVPPHWPIGRTARCDWISYPLFRTRSAGLGPRPDDAVELRSCDRNRLALPAVDPRPGLPSPRDELVLRQMPDRCLEVPVTVRALIEQRAFVRTCINALTYSRTRRFPAGTGGIELKQEFELLDEQNV